jgi:hypothetical protein
MKTEAKRKSHASNVSTDSGQTQRRNREELRLLRLEAHTVMEQIKILHQEMEDDPCLSHAGKPLLAQIKALTEEMQKIGIRLKKLETLTAA